MNERTKKIGIVSVCSIILVAMVVALTVGSRGGGEEGDVPDVSTSQKSISTICETTDYRQTCEAALASSAAANSNNPNDLIAAAFQAAIRYLNQAAENSSALRAAQSDPRAREALDTCRELAGRATRDLERSYDKFKNFDIVNVDDILTELKIWLSGAITNEETCLDGFEGIPGDASDQMREALRESMEMTSNALAMVDEISSFLETLGLQGFQSRRLLSSDLPKWMEFEPTRRLLEAPLHRIKPDVVVAKNGSGDYLTINEALKDVPKNNDKTFVVYVKEGVYEEKVWINSSLTHLMLVGDGPTKTRITGRLNFIDGTGTYQTATVAVQGDDFIARDIGFENSAGPEKHQAVALRVSADKAIFYNCHMDGYQDTLYAHTYRQFYRDCVISGTIDFVFGDAAALFQGCTFLVRKPLDNQQNIVTAQGRKDLRQPTGLVLQNCTFKADRKYYPHSNKLKSYLGRPWKEFSRTIIMESFIDGFIQPQGWLPWNETFALKTLFYTEFNNRGPGAAKAHRAKWAGVKELPSARIKRFTAAEFLDGNRWIKRARVPYTPGFIFPVPDEDPNVKYSPVVAAENKDLGSAISKESYVAAKEDKHHKGSKSHKPTASIPPPPPPSASPAPSPVSALVPESAIAASPLLSASPIGSPPISQPALSVLTSVPPVSSGSGVTAAAQPPVVAQVGDVTITLAPSTFGGLVSTGSPAASPSASVAATPDSF